MELSEAALAGGAEVVYQAAFFDGRFLGYADFIIRNDAGAYEVYDTKLARKAKITALLQLAAYSDQLQRIGVPTGERVHLCSATGARARIGCATSCRCTAGAAPGWSASSTNGSPTAGRRDGATRVTPPAGAATPATSRCSCTGTCCSWPTCA